MLIKSALESFAKYFTMAHFSIHVFFYAGVQVTRQKKVVTTTYNHDIWTQFCSWWWYAYWYGGDEWNDFVNILDDKMTEDDTNLRDENNALNDDTDDLC